MDEVSGALPCPEGTGGSEGELDALLYDWHNAYRLRAQRGDVGYWVELTSGIDRLLVVGAGTGRVAVPLARHRTRTITALDVSFARLRRMPAVPGLVPVCSDMRSLPLRSGFGAAIVPYSTLQLLLTVQDRAQALVEAARVLDKGALLHIDVSGNFARSLGRRLVHRVQRSLPRSRGDRRGVGATQRAARPRPDREVLPR